MASQPSVTLTFLSDAESIGASCTVLEVCGTRVVVDCGHELLDLAGPSHQPVFTMKAWAATSTGQRIETSPVQAPSKKAAQRLAAEHLLEVLTATDLP